MGRARSNHRAASVAALLCALMAACAADGPRTAPNPGGTPLNQLAVSGNACGPAALLNAFQSGNDGWQRAYQDVTGATERERILSVIRETGMRPSHHAVGRPRWSRRGVSVADLRDMADELAMGLYLPRLEEDVFFVRRGESPAALLVRTHRRLESSLAKGLPPVLSLRRYAMRAERGQAPVWTVIDAHFVTVTTVPRRLARGDSSFPVSYIDPWGGRRLEGVIALPAEPLFPDATGAGTCLEARFPDSAVGRRLVRKGETTVLVPAAAIGRW